MNKWQNGVKIFGQSFITNLTWLRIAGWGWPPQLSGARSSSRGRGGRGSPCGSGATPAGNRQTLGECTAHALCLPAKYKWQVKFVPEISWYIQIMCMMRLSWKNAHIMHQINLQYTYNVYMRNLQYFNMYEKLAMNWSNIIQYLCEIFVWPW